MKAGYLIGGALVLGFGFWAWKAKAAEEGKKKLNDDLNRALQPSGVDPSKLGLPVGSIVHVKNTPAEAQYQITDGILSNGVPVYHGKLVKGPADPFFQNAAFGKSDIDQIIFTAPASPIVFQ